jgi:hypothetical protein
MARITRHFSGLPAKQLFMFGQVTALISRLNSTFFERHKLDILQIRGGGC